MKLILRKEMLKYKLILRNPKKIVKFAWRMIINNILKSILVTLIIVFNNVSDNKILNFSFIEIFLIFSILSFLHEKSSCI